MPAFARLRRWPHTGLPSDSAEAERTAPAEHPAPADIGQRGGRGLAVFREAAFLLVACASLFALIRGVIGQTYMVPSSSMEGTLLVGDYVLASPVVYGVRLPWLDARMPGVAEPRSGDVVVSRPDFYDPPIDVVKRIVGVPGDTLRMTNRVLFRNGRPVSEAYTDPSYEPDAAMTLEGPLGQGWHLDAMPAGVDRASYRPTRDSWGPLVVPPGQYFLLGDNRDRSTDSRYLGFLPRSAIRAKVLLVVHSVDPDPRAGFPRVIRAARWDRFLKPVR